MTTHVATAPEAPPAGSTPTTALGLRRWFLVASPVLAGVLAVVGAAADPAAGLEGKQLFQLYADNPGPLQIKSLALHWSYAFWIAPALLVAPYVRGRGAWIATVAALLGFAGMTTLPGLLFIDWYDSAIGQLYGADGTQAVATLMEESMWGLQVFVLPGLLGFALGLPLAAVALWRAGRVRWWAPVAVVAGFLAFMSSNVMWWGCVLTTLAFTVFAVAVERGTRQV
ncbi:hypothetical protein ACFP3Q_02745 [Nocardioides sp. GCM10027113]|uniref:hypothetical protein n=1 Tax=unclassified Nocardioides TaxID=2615069 RepID=UPI003615DC19